MEITSPGPNRMMDKTIKTLSRALDFRSANHRVIAGNLANADTPGFRHKELRFDEELKRAAGMDTINLKTTNSGHISHYTPGKGNSFPVHEGEPAINGKGQLDLDMEMAKMTRNNLLYEASAKLLAKKFKALRSAIESGRR